MKKEGKTDRMRENRREETERRGMIRKEREKMRERKG